jgi:hypothetical protein
LQRDFHFRISKFLDKVSQIPGTPSS